MIFWKRQNWPLSELFFHAVTQSSAAEDGWRRIPRPFVLLCPPLREAFYRAHSCHHFNNLSNSCASLGSSHYQAEVHLHHFFFLGENINKRKNASRWEWWGGEAHAGCSSIWMALLWTVVTNPSSKVDDDIRVVAWFFEIAAFLSFFLYLFFYCCKLLNSL